MLILRRESFGGMLVDTATGSSRFLGVDQYVENRKELATRQLSGEEVRIVDVSERGYPLLSDAFSSPADLYLELTDRCDGSCVHCYASSSRPATMEELSFDDVERLLCSLALLGGYYVRLTGGEPTIRGDFFDIVEVVIGQGMIAAVNTNGLAGEATLCKMADKGVRDIRISLDGDEQANDAIRGKGSYCRIVSALHVLADHNRAAESPADPTVNMVLMKSNQHCLRHMAELVAELGFKLSIGLLRPTGRADPRQMLSPEEVFAAAREIQQLRSELRLSAKQIRANYDVFCTDEFTPGLNPFPKDNSSCAMGALGIGVTAEGRIIACNYLVNLGNGRWLGEDVRGADLLRLWHKSRVLNEARKVRRKGCLGCPHHIRRCNGGCPVTAYVLTGDLDGQDPYCVRNVELPHPDAIEGAKPCTSAIL